MGRIIDIVFFVLIGLMLIRAAKRYWKDRRYVWTVWRDFRPLMLCETILLLVVTVTAFTFLNGLGAPFSWGWYSLLVGHPGNVGVAPIIDAGESDYLLLKLAGLAIFALLAVLMPFFVRGEEIDYRKGRETWTRILPASIRFGLVHMWVGVPLSVGLALALPGLYLAWVYKRTVASELRKAGLPEMPSLADLVRAGDALEHARDRGVHRSTVYHDLYNTLLLLMVLVAVLTQL